MPLHFAVAKAPELVTATPGSPSAIVQGHQPTTPHLAAPPLIGQEKLEYSYTTKHEERYHGKVGRANPGRHQLFQELRAGRENALHQCIAADRSAALISSNWALDEWTATFGGERLTGAHLAPLTHHRNGQP